jgi:uncharacterized protein (DUF2062 family)
MIAAVISKGKLPNDFANPMTMFVIWQLSYLLSCRFDRRKGMISHCTA